MENFRTTGSVVCDTQCARTGTGAVRSPLFRLVRPANWLLLTDVSYLLTYLLTPWYRILLEKLAGLQLVKKFPAFHGTRRFITALTSVRHLSLSWASPYTQIQPPGDHLLMFLDNLTVGQAVRVFLGCLILTVGNRQAVPKRR